MANSVSSSLSDQASSLRNLKRLVVLLVVSNLALGVFSVYLLRLVDRNYSDLVGQAVPTVKSLREWRADVLMTHQAMGFRLFEAPEPKRAAALERARAALVHEKVLSDSMLARPELAVDPSLRDDLRQAAEAYGRVGAELVQLFAAGKIAEAERIHDSNLRAAFDRYFATIGKASDVVETDVLRTSDAYTVKTGRFSTIVLGLAGWPLLVFVALLLLVVVLVIAMMVAFRGKDLADAP
jgi:hypothetical protein